MIYRNSEGSERLKQKRFTHSKTTCDPISTTLHNIKYLVFKVYKESSFLETEYTMFSLVTTKDITYTNDNVLVKLSTALEVDKVLDNYIHWV